MTASEYVPFKEIPVSKKTFKADFSNVTRPEE